MKARRILAYALLTTGILCGGLGAYLDQPDITDAGIFLAVAAIPIFARMYHQNTEAELASREMIGYMRALDHVKRGLLDQGDHSDEPGPRDRADWLTGDNVIPLHAAALRHNDDRHERKAL
ncbi:hypothetical protein AB0M86_46600 [Streptomyces sp. NPDC051639]|uniref:hypothetical protein n=1 Tax=Streptomyces sp. NPDC051639 TaxID=3155671 RepID=UPI00341FB2D4